MQVSNSAVAGVEEFAQVFAAEHSASVVLVKLLLVLLESLELAAPAALAGPVAPVVAAAVELGIAAAFAVGGLAFVHHR